MKLYTYFRSSAAFRVRIALNLKGIAYVTEPIHLMRGGGEQLSPDFAEKNPQQLVPVLDHDGVLITQSLAIMEYLEEVYPTPPLLPRDPVGRARVRALALAIACDIHPLNNMRVLRYLKHQLGVDEAPRNAWYEHWVIQGMTALETMLTSGPATGTFCHGNSPTFADCLLVPQVFNALRFNCDMSQFPHVMAINQTCMQEAAFIRAAPSAQPDAE